MFEKDRKTGSPSLPRYQNSSHDVATSIRRDPTLYPKITEVDLSELIKEMPPFVARNHPRFKEWTGYSGRTMANMDSLKQTGDIMKIMLGNAVAYERNSLVRWLESRSRILCEGVPA